MVQQRHQTYTEVRAAQEKYNTNMAKSANRHRRDLEFEAGDHVYVSSKNFPLPKKFTRKLAPKWLGPFPITAKISPVAYRVDLPARYHKMHNVFHVSLLKPHHGAIPTPEAPVFGDHDAEEFEV